MNHTTIPGYLRAVLVVATIALICIWIVVYVFPAIEAMVAPLRAWVMA